MLALAHSLVLLLLSLTASTGRVSRTFYLGKLGHDPPLQDRLSPRLPLAELDFGWGPHRAQLAILLFRWDLGVSSPVYGWSVDISAAIVGQLGSYPGVCLQVSGSRSHCSGHVPTEP